MFGMQSLNKTTVIATLAMFILAGLFYSDMETKYQSTQSKLAAMTSTKISKATDYRYKSIDNELALNYEAFRHNSDGIYKCFDITAMQVIEYYKEYNVTITPFGKMLVLGNYLCDKGSE